MATMPIRFRAELDRLVDLAKERGRADDPLVRQRLAWCHSKVETMRFLGMRTLTRFLSGQHPGPDAYKGKKVVVIGSNNSSHDICAALWEHGADVTMVQRTSTHIARSDTLMDLALGGLYSEQAVANGIDHHKADLIFASVPYKIMHTFHVPVYEEMKGWKGTTSGLTDPRKLPREARAYIDRLEQLMGIPASIISTGPRREETLVLRPVIPSRS